MTWPAGRSMSLRLQSSRTLSVSPRRNPSDGPYDSNLPPNKPLRWSRIPTVMGAELFEL